METKVEMTENYPVQIPIQMMIFGDQRRLLELRYRIENQQWRIFQFLS